MRARTILLFMALTLTACEEDNFPSPEAISAPPMRVRRNVEIRDNFYNPVPVTVTVGTRVFWTNHGLEPHTVTFDAPVSFDSGWIDPNGQANRQFNLIGEFTYHCLIHPQMRGAVRVISNTFVPTL
ncbi:MAG TPA: hypothetical protein VGD27_07840 [Longimicrobiales bacterium]